MAEGGRTPQGKTSAPDGAGELLLDRPVGQVRNDTFTPLVTALGGGNLDFAAMLAIADLLPVMVAYADHDLVYRFVNRPLAQWLGVKRKELLGTPIREVIGAEAFDARFEMYRAALGGHRTFYASEFEHATRGHVAVQSDYIPWADARGKVHGIIILFEDVTEQRAYEKALKESEERFRRIANSAPAMMWVTGADGTREFVNDSYVAFTGLPADEALIADWTEAIHPDDRDHVLSLGAELLPRKKPISFEARFRRGDGEWRWLRSVSQPRLGADGALTGYIGMATDITLAKEAELDLKRQVDERTRDLVETQEQLRQSQKMEALGQLTGGIAHDFNNLLTVVVGGLDIIAKREEEPKLKRYADNALAAAERGARLTAQLLAFSRVQRLEVRPTHVAPLIQNMRPLLRNVLGPGISKEFDLAEEMVAVMADPTQLELAVLNLAINARDAMPEGGVLSFATRTVDVRNDPELSRGKYVELTIGDTGTGMAPDVAERAFEPFFTTKEVGKGTGLGLSMVYGMARQSGGTARIESRPGEGTRVMLYFRAAAADAAAEAGDEGGVAKARGRRRPASVLVIDDDPDVRTFIAATLEEQGYRVREAADGEHGLAELAREKVDLVVLDFVMPGLSGAEVASRILAKSPGQPILFVSGYSETAAIRLFAPGAPLLAKPFRADALGKAVQAALSTPAKAGAQP